MDAPPHTVDKVPVEVHAKWGHGITFSAGDLFSLELRSRIQIQGFVSVPSDGALAAGAENSVENGFLIRRMRLALGGHLFTPKLTYRIQLGLATRDMERDLLSALRDAYVTYTPLRDLNIRFGQMKVPYGKQRVVSSSSLQMVDLSAVTAELNLDRDVGLYLLSDDFLGLSGRLAYAVGVFSGLGRNRTPGKDTLLYFGRIQVNPFGRFDDLVESDAKRLKVPRMSIGIGAAHNLNTNRKLSTFGDVYTASRFSYAHFGADLHFKYAGASLISEVFYRMGDPDERDVLSTTPPGKEYSRSALGYYVQAGYVMPVLPFEVVGRFGEIYPDRPTDPALVHQIEAGGGLNYYFFEHSLKIQTDYFYLWSESEKAIRHQMRIQAQVFF